jgi:DNA replication protein DnaC
MLGELRLPGIKLAWAALAATADKEGWPAARFLAALAEQEMAERNRRRIERHLEEADCRRERPSTHVRLRAVPMISKAQVMALAPATLARKGFQSVLCSGRPGGGKSHLAAALGLALVEKGWRVLFTRTTDLVQKLQIARREFGPRSRDRQARQISPADPRRHRLCHQGSGRDQRPVRADRARYERRSMMITANQPFGEWGKIFPDQAMTLAAIDRLVHHATILEMNVDSYRRFAFCRCLSSVLRSVSSRRSSNRASGFPAHGFHSFHQAFALGRSARRAGMRKSPSVSCR